MCISPIEIPIRNEKGKIERWQQVPCMNCPECQKKYSDDWAFRAMLELSVCEKAVMITLTYSDLFLWLQTRFYDDGTVNSLQKEEPSRFIKRLRKVTGIKGLRYLVSGEYGKHFTERPHYHIVLFGIDNNHPIFDSKVKFYKNGKPGYYITDFPQWRYGHIELNFYPIDAGAIRYATKYAIKEKGKTADDMYKIRKIHPQFINVSRKPGLGYYGLIKNLDLFKHQFYGHLGSRKISLPRYCIDKIEENVDFDYRELVRISYKIRRNRNLEQERRNYEAKNKMFS